MNILKHAIEIHKKSYNYFTKQIPAICKRIMHMHVLCIVEMPTV